jgi:DNA replication protein DnaC
MTESENLKANLGRLGLKPMAEVLENEADLAVQLKTSYSGYFSPVVEEELLAKTERSVDSHIKNAHLPYGKTLESFQYAFQPGFSQMLITELAELGFLGRHENIILIGPPGVGKTHLAIWAGNQNLYCPQAGPAPLGDGTTGLADRRSGGAESAPAVRMQALSRLHLLIIHSLGYLPMDKPRANLCLQMTSPGSSRTR